MVEKIDKNSIPKSVKGIISFGSLHSSDAEKNYNDEFSDLDIFVFTTTPNEILSIDSIGWLACFGTPMSVIVIENPFQNTRITRIIYDDLFSIDYIPVSYSKFSLVKKYLFLKKIGLEKIIPNLSIIQAELKAFYSYLIRGYTMLYDTKNMEQMIHKIEEEFTDYDDSLVTAKKFNECYLDFWHSAYKILGKIKRNDMYYALVLLDNIFKRRLVQMIEWETRYFYKSNEDLFYLGKKISQWSDEATYKKLKKTIFSFNEKQNMETLLTHVHLFQKASKNVADVQGYQRQTELETKIVAKINAFANEPQK
ncbi:aminoglycoside 6-adenylyltransferase [Kordia jejudonensis]|uniref:aminoglycoside 6-adenylyltransferase n=1 Tax=Kordia jejudonensis TaxID=1348245 RepID=UPI000629A05F|nr:aminoglycoside 6-adenylyltransferase [Kordia jejudonensis]